jgi:hypothetical protein
MKRLCCMILCSASLFAQSQVGHRTLQDRLATERARGGPAPTGPALLVDHGGPVLASSQTLAIFWGQGGDFPVDYVMGMDRLFRGLDRSSYLGIAQQYMRRGSIGMNYQGYSLDSSTPPARAPKASDLGAEVCKLYPQPVSNGIYFVFTSNVPRNVSYCAWHDKASCNGVTFQVAYIPNQGLLPGCSPYKTVNLGCNRYSTGTATAADSVAHEFMEAVTDPLLTAWYDKTGAEIADKCEYKYTSCVALPGTGDTWQIQQEWSNAVSACVQQ